MTPRGRREIRQRRLEEGMRLRPWGETSEASAASVRGAYPGRKEHRVSRRSTSP